MLLFGLLGCPKPGTPSVDVATEAAVTQLDMLWGARGGAGLEPASRAFAELPPDVARTPAVLWRRARLEVAKGVTADDPLDARRAYARARAAGMSCLAGDPRLVADLRGRRLADAAAAAPAPRVPCAAWAGYAWARWLATLDAGAVAVDLGGARALLERGVQADDPRAQEVARWGQAILAALTPASRGGDPEVARSRLVELARASTADAWVRYEDVLQLFPRATVQPPRRAPATPEERAAAERVQGSTNTTPRAVPPESDAAPGSR